jgi:hypothetical protein
MSPSTGPVRPRPCRCERPLLDDETCLHCGRPPARVAAPAPQSPELVLTWTRAHVARAFEAFAFFRGRAPVVADWSRRMENWPPLETVEAIFGSVEAAVAAAGLERR